MTESDDKPLGFLLYRVASRLRPEVTAELQPLGLSLPQVACMRMLSENPGLTSAELARDTPVSAQAMNRLLRSLQDLGAVTRTTTTSNQRMPAQLTKRGKALLKRATAAAYKADRQVLAHLTQADQHQLKRLLVAAGNPATDDADPAT
ncbi:MarR family winged helix-turn-helix transcriptional regulator [Mycobacterium spongiae]|uniref:MarR family transcriptional regulator n=1 Tax=Mycobacterium spongiae TaxID=886343 RepID=A0A975JZZ6_9MYCO|nr:MarR family transcriptional regulator [Mycobacterium spongiae]QUR68841.1 MarR family transcriptional regulator [Mycobacterium spongiae]